MPQKYHRREGAKARSEFPPDLMKRAVREVLEGKKTIRGAAKSFGLDRNTLRRYLRKIKSGKKSSFKSEYVGNMIFTKEEEAVLAKYLEKMALMAHGLTCKLARKLAYDLAVKNGKKIPSSWEKNKHAGYYWLSGFLQRNRALSIRTPEATSLSRATSFNKHNVGSFFSNLKAVLERESFGPESIWNVDETGVVTVQRCPRIIAPKKMKQVGSVTSAERGDLVTICNAINALGNSIPPFFVFPRKKPNPAFLFGAPAGSDYGTNPSGWMNEETFLQTLRHFVKYVKCSVNQKVLLLLDNHESHISLPAIDYARANGIVMLTFPPHCSHRLQPLDVSVYGPFKTFFNSWCSNRVTHEKPGIPITIYDIASLIGKSFPQAFTMTNIQSGFRATGIYPLNEHIFPETAFLPSSVTDRPAPGSSGVTKSSDVDTLGPLNGACDNDENDGILDGELLATGLIAANLSLNEDTEIWIDAGEVEFDSSLLAEDDPIFDAATTNVDSLAWPLNIASTSSGTHNIFPSASPEDVVPFPTAGVRKTTRKGRKKGKTTILTDTPSRNEIVENMAEKQAAKNLKKKKEKNCKRARKSLSFVDVSKKSTKPEVQPTASLKTDSEDEDSMATTLASSDESNDDVYPAAFTNGDWVVVKYAGKKSVKRYVGEVVNSSEDGLEVKFARRVDENRFRWPDQEDVAEIDPSQIEECLEAPKMLMKNDRITGFVFKNHRFEYIVE